MVLAGKGSSLEAKWCKMYITCITKQLYYMNLLVSNKWNKNLISWNLCKTWYNKSPAGKNHLVSWFYKKRKDMSHLDSKSELHIEKKVKINHPMLKVILTATWGTFSVGNWNLLKPVLGGIRHVQGVRAKKV